MHHLFTVVWGLTVHKMLSYSQEVKLDPFQVLCQQCAYLTKHKQCLKCNKTEMWWLNRKFKLSLTTTMLQTLKV